MLTGYLLPCIYVYLNSTMFGLLSIIAKVKICFRLREIFEVGRWFAPRKLVVVFLLPFLLPPSFLLPFLSTYPTSCFFLGRRGLWIGSGIQKLS